MPTYRAVGALAVQFGAGPVGDILAASEADMANGASLSRAFRTRERELGHLSCAMVEAGEATGQLGESLNRLADILENQARLRRKVLTAMTYPIFALVLSIVVFLGMVFFVVPIFAGIYDDLDADLPLITTTLVAITKFLVGYTYVAVAVVAAAAFGYWRVMKLRWVRRERDRFLLRIPMFGKLIKASIMSRVMSIVSSTMGAGVPLLEGIAVSAEAAGNIVFEDALVRVRESVRDGRSFHFALGEESVFPPLLSRVVETGRGGRHAHRHARQLHQRGGRGDRDRRRELHHADRAADAAVRRRSGVGAAPSAIPPPIQPSHLDLGPVPVASAAVLASFEAAVR